MQLKLPMELAEQLKTKLSELRAKTTEVDVLKKLTYNNLLRCYIHIGMNLSDPNAEYGGGSYWFDDDILKWIGNEGMSRGRPSSEN